MTALDPRLFVVHCDFHRFFAGGQRQLLHLARGLAAHGVSQWIATPPDGALAVEARAAGLEVVPHPIRGEIDPRATLRTVRWLRRLRPTVIHTHDTHALTPAAVAARLVRPRPAVVAHRRVDFAIRSHPLSRWKHAHGPDRVIAVSRHVRAVLADCGVAEKRIRVVHDGVAPRSGPPAGGPTLRQRLDVPADARLVLTFASLTPRKDHPTLLAAAERLVRRDPPTRWIVLGDGPLLDTVAAEVCHRGLHDRVTYAGFLADARERLPEADAFVLTSRNEASGSSLLEAMAAGVPVVATAAGGIPEIVEHGRSGLLVAPGHATALAGAIDRVLDDSRLARRLTEGGEGRARVFGVERMVNETLAVYRSVVDGTREDVFRPDLAGSRS